MQNNEHEKSFLDKIINNQTPCKIIVFIFHHFFPFFFFPSSVGGGGKVGPLVAGPSNAENALVLGVMGLMGNMADPGVIGMGTIPKCSSAPRSLPFPEEDVGL